MIPSNIRKWKPKKCAEKISRKMPPQKADVSAKDGTKKIRKTIKMKMMLGEYPKKLKCGKKLLCKSVKKYKSGKIMTVFNSILKFEDDKYFVQIGNFGKRGNFRLLKRTDIHFFNLFYQPHQEIRPNNQISCFDFFFHRNEVQ